MGNAACEAIAASDDLRLVAAVGRSAAGDTIGGVEVSGELKAFAEAETSMVWYPKKGPELIGATADYARTFQKDLGTYHCTGDMKRMQDERVTDALTFDYIRDAGAAMVGDPDRCIEIAKRYEAAGCDLLFCLANPYDMTHEQVMSSLELLGKHVIPELDKG